MNLKTFKSLLRANPDRLLAVLLPDGETVPASFHVTEVGHVSKRFIDCGGTARHVECAQLQVWLGSDEDHRLTAGKLADILDLAQPILPSDGLDLEIEYEDCAISQYPVASAEVAGDKVRITLVEKHTDCLAKEACGIEAAPRAQSNCCGGTGCC